MLSCNILFFFQVNASVTMDGYSVHKVIGEGSFGRALLVQSRINRENYVMKEILLPKVGYYYHLKKGIPFTGNYQSKDQHFF